MTSLVESGSSAKPIDWASWDARISNKEVLGCLKSFHEQQSTLLEQVLKEDHGASATWRKRKSAGYNGYALKLDDFNMIFNYFSMVFNGFSMIYQLKHFENH